ARFDEEARVTVGYSGFTLLKILSRSIFEENSSLFDDNNGKF
ncbi:hypothetical protein MNBD_GAMMA02-965, partial [hydrothermal vent metagenome]